MSTRERFGWNPRVGDRVEGVGAHGGTGHYGTVTKRRRDGFVIDWDNGGRSVHQSYGFQPATSPAPASLRPTT